MQSEGLDGPEARELRDKLAEAEAVALEVTQKSQVLEERYTSTRAELERQQDAAQVRRREARTLEHNAHRTHHAHGQIITPAPLKY